jgi:hypothetical protein
MQERQVAGAQRAGEWMITFTGRRFWPLDPRAEDVSFRDIGHGLSLVCRYGGHVRRFYSVAEHCTLLATWFESRQETVLARWALLHDAAEAYIGDIIRPLKPWLPEFAVVEHQIERAIFARAGLFGEIPPQVHAADKAIISDEGRELFRPETRIAAGWVLDDRLFDERAIGQVVGWPPHEAERHFAMAFARLFPEHELV